MEFKGLKKWIFGMLAIIGLIWACSSDNSSSPEPDPEDDSTPAISAVEEGRAQQIETLFDSQISPQQVNHRGLVSTLKIRADEFIADPNANTLSALKQAWSEAFLLWKEMEIYNIGIIQSSFAHSKIHQWPVNTEFIEENITDETTIDNAFVNSIGASSKGYGAIEYLIFSAAEDEILLAFTSGDKFEVRGEYLVALAENLEEQALALQELWNTAEESFKTRLETGVNGSQNQIVNALIAGLETIKLKKLPSSSEATVEDLEAFYSETSKQAIIANLNSLFRSYRGDFGSEGYGLEEFVTQVLDNADLNERIEIAFQDAIDAAEAIDTTLEEAMQNNVAGIDALRDAVTEVIVLFKTDLSSAANIVVTFNDNDGDSQ
ncbi:MAG: imelysin family protein, partial [Bacteroidota bacterium]